VCIHESVASGSVKTPPCQAPQQFFLGLDSLLLQSQECDAALAVLSDHYVFELVLNIDVQQVIDFLIVDF